MQPHPSQEGEESCHTTTDEHDYCAARLNLSCYHVCEWVPSTKNPIDHGNILLWQWLGGCSLTRFFPICEGVVCKIWAHNKCSISTMANKRHPCLTLKSPWLQFLHNMALQLIHHSVSLQSPVFTSSTSNNDFGGKGQFSCLIVHVCLQESNSNLVRQQELVQVDISKK